MLHILISGVFAAIALAYLAGVIAPLFHRNHNHSPRSTPKSAPGCR